MATKLPLGSLERLDPRDCWSNEASDFTPWLATEAGLQLLGDAIGVELELEAVEKDVGPFRADIIGRNTADETLVLVENQLARTDHTHLGQILTYAAGLQAVTIVWIARRITEEHRAALDWLNEITDKRFNFFGLEIELWRIGGSDAAPKLNIVSQPNDWSKVVASPTELTDTKKLQQEYWSAFREHVADEGARFKTTKALPQHWMNIAIGKSGFQLSAIASVQSSVDAHSSLGELRAEFVVRHSDGDFFYDTLYARSEELAAAIGDQLVWHNPDETKSWRVYVRRPADISDRDDWPDQHEWLRVNLDRMYEVFQPEVQDLAG